jgi:dTMP kinase
MFLTLEGPDGSGKSTQARLLAEHLKARGRNILLTREPGGTTIGDQIRTVLMNLRNTGMCPEAEFLLFSASRAQHVRELIRPHLEAGAIVVCDRYYDSSLAYQGYGHRLDLEALRRVTAFATDHLTPDLTLLLDLPAEEGLQRRREDGNWNRLDAYEREFHERVRQGYLAMAAAEPDRWIVLDARQSVEALQVSVQQAVLPRLPA